MSYYIAHRLLQTAATACFVVVLVFALARLTGDPVALMMPANATQEDFVLFRQKFGLDKSMIEQLYIFVVNAARGDFGSSFYYSMPAMDLVLSRVPATSLLAFASVAWAVLAGIPLGVIAAVNRGSTLDVGIRAFATVGQSTPNFWFGIMLILVFAVNLGWTPSSGYGSVGHLVLPAITLGWLTMASIIRLTRASMIEALQSDYVKLERLSGVPERLVLFKHALKNSSAPILIFTALQFGALLGGAVVTETVFAWPGIGKLVVDAIMQRDFPVIQAAVLLMAMFFLVLNLFVDLIYSWIDPRIRL